MLGEAFVQSVNTPGYMRGTIALAFDVGMAPQDSKVDGNGNGNETGAPLGPSECVLFVSFRRMEGVD